MPVCAHRYTGVEGGKLEPLIGFREMQRTLRSANKNQSGDEDAQAFRCRLIEAQTKLAILVIDNPAYIPIFERVELELAALDEKNSIIARARAVAAQHQMALA